MTDKTKPTLTDAESLAFDLKFHLEHLRRAAHEMFQTAHESSNDASLRKVLEGDFLHFQSALYNTEQVADTIMWEAERSCVECGGPVEASPVVSLSLVKKGGSK